MVKVWGSSNKGTTACEECGSLYSVVEHRLPVRDKDSANCIVCGHELASWNSTTFPVFTLIEKGKKPQAPDRQEGQDA
ncbi:hypothetical protein Rvan_1233 [Rhodomicrobium vannielii ATCC 17100]|uniref:Uncharacterized protein n=1 Tax=Rhodomicrobium vannielii (strain ATCC 17100 / DSM 162 / LMG 4299 / NCIMB 10020 / ATH 3.1.1) TaxID=648757 RepID=E3I551_RHOVT|nr:hypothetical protein Rvan_1233 [Rhodomicrobium vannielii ATCC 17100]